MKKIAGGVGLLLLLCAACSSEPSDGGSEVPGSMQPGNMLPGGMGGAGGTSGQVPGMVPNGSGGSAEGQGGNLPVGNNQGGGGPISGMGGMAMNPPAMGGTGGTGVVPTPGNEVYVGENGNDANPGTAEAPFATITRAHALARPGLTIFVLPGTVRLSATQSLSVNGQQGNTINLYAAPGARPIIDFAGQPRQDTSARGFILNGNFWHVRGLDIRNAGDNGMLIIGSNNLIENVIFRDNGDSGLQITAPEAQATNSALASNNLVLNCDSFNNFDPANNGENADGFAAKLRIGPGNVFRGCRAWNNADDGWDFFAADDVVTIEDSWAFLNGIIAGGGNSAGDGNGFKLGGAPDGVGQGHAPHIVRGGSAFDNRTCGFTINNNDEEPVLSDCGIGGNDNDYCGLDCNGEFDVGISGAQAITRARNADGSLPSLE